MWERCVCVCSDDLVVCISNLHAYVHPPAQLILLCQGILKKLESQFLVLSIESIAYVFVSSFCVFCTQVTAAPSAWDKAPPPPPPREDASLEPRDRICRFAHSFFWGCVFSFQFLSCYMLLRFSVYNLSRDGSCFRGRTFLHSIHCQGGVQQVEWIIMVSWPGCDMFLCAICSRSS